MFYSTLKNKNIITAIVTIRFVVAVTADEEECCGEQARFSSENQAVLPTGRPNSLIYISKFGFTE